MRTIFSLPINILPIFCLTGCWNIDPVRISTDVIPFTPAAGVDVDYSVHSVALPVFCPDGEPASLTVISPTQPQPSAIYTLIFHSGALDYIEQPEEDPTVGDGYNQNTHLTSAWAKRQIFTTLGMFESADPLLQSDGTLVASLAEAGVSIIMPTNCWGDLWHNQSGIANNDYVADHFSREGRTVAQWSWDLLRDYDNTSAALGVTLTTPPHGGQPIVIGLGTGSRAIGEIINNWADPLSIMVDSAPDNLTAVAHDDKFLTALGRIAPEDIADLDVGSLANARYMPPRVVAIFSPSDSRFPPESIEPLITTVMSLSEGMVIEAPADTHLTSLTNVDDIREAVYWLVNASPWNAPEATPDPTQFANCVATQSRQTDADEAIDRVVVSTFDVSGKLYTLATDNDADGVFNTQETYDESGNQTELATNTNDDGDFDRREISYWDDGRLTRTEQDSANDGDVDFWCDYTYSDDDIGRPITMAGACDDDGNGTIDRDTRTTFVYDYEDDNYPLSTGTIAVGSFHDLESDGAIDSAVIRVYDQGDSYYAQPLWERFDDDANGTPNEIWGYSYADDLMTAREHDDNADDVPNWRESFLYNANGTLSKSREDDTGDGEWDNAWHYSYTDAFLDTVQYDIGQDDIIDEVWTTVWDCP